MRVTADFLEDIRAQLVGELERAGFPVPDETRGSAVSVCELYFNVRHRILRPRPRRVHRSRELGSRELVDHLRIVVDEIERRAQLGEPLNPFLHRALTNQPDFNDRLLNDWGIHHLHLGGLTPAADGYMPRSRELLFAFFRGDDAYLLDVRDHGSFEDDELIEIIHSNWPEAIADCVAEGVRVDEEDRFSRDARRQLRRGGFSVLTVVRDGTVYVAPGGGYVKSGLSLVARRQADWLCETAVGLQRQFTDRAQEEVAFIKETVGDELQEAHFRLILAPDGALVVIETQSRVCFRMVDSV